MYNETVTVASIKAVHHFRRRVKGSTFRDLLAEFPRLSKDFKGLINKHYTQSIFESVAAS